MLVKREMMFHNLYLYNRTVIIRFNIKNSLMNKIVGLLIWKSLEQASEQIINLIIQVVLSRLIVLEELKITRIEDVAI